MPQELTPKQNRILAFIQRYVSEFQGPPSFREIGKKFGISTGTVWDQIEALKKKGFLEKDESRARGLRLPIRADRIPIVGRVFAGSLHAAFENIEGYILGDPRKGGQEFFALKVKGDSMKNAGIFDGDLVIVRKQQVAENGDIIVALVEDEATVKYFRHKGRSIYLEPANPDYKPIHNAYIKVAGKVIEVRRRYE